MTSRGSIAARQRTNSYRPNGQVAAHILATTILDTTITQTVKRARATSAFTVGSVIVRTNQTFYLVASKFANRFYVVLPGKDGWTCASSDARVSAKCIDQASKYRQSLIAKLVTKIAA